MNDTTETTRPTMAERVTEYGATMTATEVDTYPGAGKPWDAWANSPGASHWRVTIKRGGRKMSTHYHQGSAHNEPPKIDDVLGCLVSDASGADQSFENWCPDYGYDVDSRRAESCYKSCVRIRAALIRVFGADGLEALLYETEPN